MGKNDRSTKRDNEAPRPLAEEAPSAVPGEAPVHDGNGQRAGIANAVPAVQMETPQQMEAHARAHAEFHRLPDKIMNMAGTEGDLDYERASSTDDIYQRRLFLPKNVGDTFIGQFIAFRTAEELEMKYDGIEMRTWEGSHAIRGKAVILPKHEQLMQFLMNVQSDKGDPTRITRNVFKFTVDEVVMDKERPEKVAFVHYDIREANPGLPAPAPQP